MSTVTKFSFTEATTYDDGTPITPADIANLVYVIAVDTIDPPLNSFIVPAADIAAAVAGVVTVPFADIGFVPAPNVKYFARVTEASGLQVSVPSNEISFTNVKTPNPPTGFSVA